MWKKGKILLAIAWLTTFILLENDWRASALQSGKPLAAATALANSRNLTNEGLDFRPPLSAGYETRPIGVANVYKGPCADLFVVNGRMSTDPGLFLYQCLGYDSAGVPKFRRRLQVVHPFKGLHPPVGSVLQVEDKIIGFFYLQGRYGRNSTFSYTRFDKKSHEFVDRKDIEIQGIPRSPSNLALILRKEKKKTQSIASVDLVLEIPEESSLSISSSHYRAPFYNTRDSRDDYNPRSSAGVWKEKITRAGLYGVFLPDISSPPLDVAARITNSARDIPFSYSMLSPYIRTKNDSAARPAHQETHHDQVPELMEEFSSLNNFPEDISSERSIISGSYSGHLFYFQNFHQNKLEMYPRMPLRDEKGQAIVHPNPRPMPIVLSGPHGEPNLLVGGEGPLYFYRYVLQPQETSFTPLYEPPLLVSELGAQLYGGSHPIINLMDWDKDGREDIISGSVDGKVQLFKNVGTNSNPQYLPGMNIRFVGGNIHIQPGYQALEGPAESSYGYTCPRVADWNFDGNLDIILNDATGVPKLFLGDKWGELQKPVPLLLDGLELGGPWRVVPDYIRLDGRGVLITVDEENELHAYYRLEKNNLRDIGKLRLRTGKAIETHALAGGAQGRIHINAIDWDLDGVLDLLLGVPRHASIPDKDSGLPRAIGLPGATTLFLRGKSEKGGSLLPTFAFPEILKHDGEPVFLGRVDGSVTVSLRLEDRFHGPHLLVGEESGRVVFYDRRRLSSESFERFVVPGKKGGAFEANQENLARRTVSVAPKSTSPESNMKERDIVVIMKGYVSNKSLEPSTVPVLKSVMESKNQRDQQLAEMRNLLGQLSEDRSRKMWWNVGVISLGTFFLGYLFATATVDRLTFLVQVLARKYTIIRKDPDRDV